MSETSKQYQQIIQICRDLFLKKTTDYGTSWRIMRPSSITDQIYIKAQRIRTIEQTGVSKVGESIEDEYVGIVNYCLIAMMQLDLEQNFTSSAAAGSNPNADSTAAPEPSLDLSVEEVTARYDQAVQETYELMLAKNHDYGEAWREMRISSLTDLILTKIHRTKQIEDNHGQTLVSEGVRANYQDMMNYAIFALIRTKL